MSMPASTPPTPKQHQLNFIAGGGEMGELTRSYDWSSTPLGNPEHWPLSLKTTVGIILHSAFPMFLMWGEKLTCFYNDSFLPSLGVEGKHPALGKPGKEVWGEIWDQIWPWLKQVMDTGKPVFFEDQLVPFFRNGRMEDIYWTFSYSPAYGDDGAINGVFVTCFETTPKILLLEKMADSRRQFENLIRDATVGIVVLTGKEKKVVIVNAAYGRIIDRTVEELQGKLLWDVIPEVREEFDPMLEQVRLTGKPVYLYDHPYTVYSGDKQIHGFLNVVYQPFREEDGTITGIMALVQDVTEQVMDHQKVRASELRVRSIVESAPFPIGVYTGREMRIELMNKSIMDLWGKGYELTGKTYAEVLPELEGTGIYEQLDSVFMTGVPIHYRDQRVDLVVDGKLRPFYFNYSFTPLYDEAGQVYGVMNTGADVTDLHLIKQKIEQSEKNFRNMVLQAPVAMCILLGPEHKVEVVNNDMLAIWGKDASVIGMPVFDAVPDARAQGLEELMKKVYETGESFTATEHPVQLHRNGRWDIVYQNFVYDAYRDSDGTILGVLAISVDVTPQVLARLQIEEIVAQRTRELASTNANLNRSNEDLAQFAYIASHDLQEPVRKVSTFAQMLAEHLDNSDERAAGYLEKIQRSADRMLVLIRDVLAYSQLSREAASPAAHESLSSVMEEVVNDFELLIAQKQARISWTTLPVVRAIPLQMSQLFANLLSNSLKFAATDRPPVITVSAGIASRSDMAGLPMLEQSVAYHHIILTDNGIGFSQENSEKIFSIFQRLHGKKEYDGTGIGLSTCRKIVQNHGGHIYANSVKGAGTTFHILLPA